MRVGKKQPIKMAILSTRNTCRNLIGQKWTRGGKEGEGRGVERFLEGWIGL
jgi:hypothetical protein